MPVAMAVATALGVLVGERFGPGKATGALVALALTAGGLVVARSVGAPARMVPITLGLLAVALLGAASMQRALDGLSNSAIGRLRDHHAEAEIDGSLVDDPTGSRFTTRFVVRVSRVAGRPAPTRSVLASAGGDAASRLRLLQAGDEVRLSGYFAPLSGYDRRYRWRHVVAVFDVDDTIAFHPSVSPTARVANSLRARVLAGEQRLPATERALVAGFLLGDTRSLPHDVQEAFRAAGLSHLLVVSGENVAFVLAITGPALRRLGLRAQLVGGLAVLVLFGTMTRWEPSVLRACVMAACSMTAVYLGRPAAGLRVLAITVLILLVVDPFLVHSVAFALSCGASGGITLLARPISSRLRGPIWVRDGLAVTIAAQLGVAPVLIPVFGSVPLASLPANLLAVPLAAPLTSWGLVSGLVGGVVGPWWPGLAGGLQLGTRVLADAMLGIASAGSRLPVQIDGRGACALGGLTAVAAAIRQRRSLRCDGAVPARRARARRDDAHARHGHPEPHP